MSQQELSQPGHGRAPRGARRARLRRRVDRRRLVIGPVPGPATPPAQLVPFYTFLFLLMAALAGLAARAVPRWLAWPALLLAVLSLLPGPFGFLASMVFLAWTAAAGITLLVAHQPRPQFARATTVPAKEVRHA